MTHRLRPRPRAWMLGPLAIAVVAMLAPPGSSTAAPTPGAAGTDTDLAPTESTVKVKGRDRFAAMEFTINQTQDLTTQAVSISWTGGVPTPSATAGTNWASDFVQIFQCWGEDDGTNPANPGPPPEQCQQGARNGAPESAIDEFQFPNLFSAMRIISGPSFANYRDIVASGVGAVDSVTGNVFRPFRAVNGNVTGVHVNSRFNPAVQGGSYWLNAFFNIITTNEIAAARTLSNGTGSELFQVQTGLDSPGLGCGQRSQPQADGTKAIPKCWIVIVPRGDPNAENVGAATGTHIDPTDAQVARNAGVVTSPLMPGVWEHRIAVPIEFKPVDSPCDLADQERRLVGSELAQQAITSWQPTLCTTDGLPPYSFAPVGDAGARQQLAASVVGGPGMVLISRPLSGVSNDPKSPAVYAPITVSGVVIGFNIERVVNLEGQADPAQKDLKGVRVQNLNLTPRLIAKLLTQSYRSQTDIQAVSPKYPWAEKNPMSLLFDPDFLRFNPEFEWLSADLRLTGGLQVPSGNFDAASQLWDYVFADPEAKAWLDGAADEWGMRVNPVYSTSSDVNPNGAFGDPLPNSFPKADANCYQAPPVSAAIVPPPLCGTDWMPYVRTFAEGAFNARAGNDPAKIVANPFPQASSDYWKRDNPIAAGNRAMLAVTDTTSAARFGLQTARLTRPGDNGDSRVFIAPTEASLLAGVATMAAKDVPTFLEPNPRADAPGAYPLAAVTYAAIKPLSLDATARSEYASFIEYAAGPGQSPGFDFGELPLGYVPMPQALRDQAIATAKVVRDPASLVPAAAAGPTTTVPTTAAPTGAAVTPVVSGGTTRTTSSGSTSRPSSSGTSAGAGAVVAESSVPTSEATPTSEPPTAEETPVTTVAPEADVPTTTAAPAVTQPVDLPKSRYIVVGLGVVALLSALFALEITKRTRRATVDDLPGPESDDSAPIELTLMEQTVDA